MATGLIVSVVLITRSCSGKFTCALPIQGKLGDTGMTLEKGIQGACIQTGFSQKISHLHRQEGRLWTFASQSHHDFYHDDFSRLTSKQGKIRIWNFISEVIPDEQLTLQMLSKVFVKVEKIFSASLYASKREAFAWIL